MDGTVLIADDDRTIRTVLAQALMRAGCKVHATSSLTTLMRWISEGMGDVVISDVMMPDGNGLEMLPKIAEVRPGLPVIIISAQNTVMTAIRAAEAEAWDYLPKPFDLPDLMARTARALTSHGADRARAPQPTPNELPLIGQSAPMQALFRVLARVMNTDLPVWISGESGTGKSLIARVIHDVSDRRARPYLALGPADLPADGAPAAILARADGGTIVLDGLFDFDANAQLRALRLIDAATEAGPDTQPRIIATAQKSGQVTGPQIGQGLRDDLYFRLAGAVIEVPPLRARSGDISLLVTHFLYLSEEAGGHPRRLAPDALDALNAYDWPGNVRELEHAARRLALGGRAPLISHDEVAALLATRPAAPVASAQTESLSQAVAAHVQRYFDLHAQELPPPGLYARILREVEAPLLRIALDAVGGNQVQCAELLGMNRNTLRKKMTSLDIEVTRRPKLM
ncbi:response regulator [Roseovarius sp. Pro17]|uniref:response regulator n=1 Tax=Roseovarius sp. Pro17 TaxID=3108175 RepID=UPI002D77236E|nr:response regulator [Roseovarius sp. Pro17]